MFEIENKCVLRALHHILEERGATTVPLETSGKALRALSPSVGRQDSQRPTAH